MRAYRVVGNRSLGYGVRHRDGYMEYDLVESRLIAEVICRILNKGIGPEWDAVEKAIGAKVIKKLYAAAPTPVVQEVK